MSKKVIKVENLSKQYRLGQVGTGTLSHDLNRWWHLIRGKEDPYLEISEINKQSRFATSDYVWALKNISFEVEEGEVLGIIGNNGAGKSTLLKILSKITSPTQGSVKAKGRIASLLEVGTGFHPELTGRENIFLNGTILGMTKKEVSKRMDEIIDFAGVSRYLDTPIKRFSTGMKVRLGFAIAAHLEPEILVIDEVLAVGDIAFQNKAIGKMREVNQNKGRTVLFVSHNLASVKRLCTRSMLLGDGQIQKIGKSDEIIQYYLNQEKAFKNTPLRTRKDRTGNGLFRFEKLDLIDANQNKIDQILSGEYLQVVLKYKHHVDIQLDNMIITVGFKDDSGNFITFFASDEMGFSIQANSRSEVILEIPELLLRGGTYSLWIFSSYENTNVNNFCDIVDSAAELRVIPSDFWNAGRTTRPMTAAIFKGAFRC